MAKTVTLRIENDVYQSFVKHAEEERRSLGKFIEHATLQYTKTAAFADDEEMRAINADEGLQRRLRQGAEDMKKRRGRFVA